ncbi:DUF2325 domain-containing protein [uncultured Acidovorax sp.]|uniref:DUF2325 domain-containing protein n=1 Tax=uncultured Acidovorax sp. TaxID=158751 RepID=UPI002583773F|nr:DUF2325 domain-containing protein [uncultured Acidovorax sp.]
MHTLSQEFLALCRQLGEAQTRCSEVVAAQAAELERLQREVVRLRAAVIVRDTQLELARAALEDARQAQPPGQARRKDMARHIRMLAERVASLSRECLRWRLQAAVQEVSEPAAPPQDEAEAPAAHPMPAHQPPHALDISLAAADMVICQTGCISHDDYWRCKAIAAAPASPAFWWTRRHCLLQRRAPANPW